ncbi:hypothetical protein B1R32_11247 [Abditibacterium utsteinense]|uniref:Uncharacterized protein n=1 Tax=Abditibacterium utsteinense TaxID=1960156 RepID=A0A2S8SRE8_9BACT|nr:hypothetical protein [Abditibacterium utsteinense]PQV63392.1 hypothetical protein B1R32_11247 [Abditibacterium utsteinense]
MITLQITRNGRDVTNPKNPEVPVMVGERNQMGVSVSPSPQIPTYQWTIPGDKIKDYLETPVSPNTTPPFTAEKVELPASDLQIQSPYFYWYNGSFTGESREVSVVVNVYGTPITLKSKFKVYRPRMDSYTGTYTPRNPPAGYDTYSKNGIGYDFLGLGTPDGNKNSPGITYLGKVSTPSIPNAAGEVAYTQLITANSEESIAGQGHTRQQATDALDSAYPPRYGGSDAIAAGVSAQSVAGNDSPGAVGNNAQQTGDFFKQDSQFKAYLVYKPNGTGSIWVTLGVLNWSFKMTATLNLNNPPTYWDVTDQFPTVQANGDSPAPITGTDSTTLPEYSERIQDHTPVPVAP